MNRWVFLWALVLSLATLFVGYGVGVNIGPNPTLRTKIEDAAVAEYKQQYEGCRLWNVLTPADSIGSSFYIGGWVRECDGKLGPLIQFGPEEAPEEVLLRIENYLANMGYGRHERMEAP